MDPVTSLALLIADLYAELAKARARIAELEAQAPAGSS
jgi:hypothetical protein